jgi:hypothetical protein
MKTLLFPPAVVLLAAVGAGDAASASRIASVELRSTVMEMQEREMTRAAS